VARRKLRKRKKFDMAPAGPALMAPPTARPSEGMKPPPRSVAKPPPSQMAPGPSHMTPSAEAQMAPDTTEVGSKFRWGVDVGHYYWRGGGGGAGPMNVGWGKHGATASTPRTVNEMVTMETSSAAAQGAPRKKVHRASKSRSSEATRLTGNQNMDGGGNPDIANI
jgi:hypothetical protein